METESNESCPHPPTHPNVARPPKEVQVGIYCVKCFQPLRLLVTSVKSLSNLDMFFGIVMLVSSAIYYVMIRLGFFTLTDVFILNYPVYLLPVRGNNGPWVLAFILYSFLRIIHMHRANYAFTALNNYTTHQKALESCNEYRTMSWVMVALETSEVLVFFTACQGICVGTDLQEYLLQMLSTIFILVVRWSFRIIQLRDLSNLIHVINWASLPLDVNSV